MPHPYIHVNQNDKYMNTELVKQAVELFVETLPLATTDINTDSHTWHHLYSQECKLYGLMGQMSADELKTYGVTVRAIAPEDGDVGVES